MEITKKLTRFIVETGFSDLPTEALEAAKKTFMDCFGVALAGSVEPAGEIIKSLVREIEAKPVAGIIGGGFKTAPLLAALANGTMAHALDYDDAGVLDLPFHPSVPILPVTLALGEMEKASGKEIILAYILGVEVETKIAAAIKVSHFARGWHPTATIGALGATAAAAKLLKLSAEESETALGIASSLAGGLRQNFGTMTKPLHAGNAARNGVMAASLAKKGFSAASGILEAPCGFLNVFAGKGEYSIEKLKDSLGKPFHFVHPGVTIKKYPSCYGTHASIEAMGKLVKRYEIVPQEVDSIECAVPSLSEGDNSLSRPQAKTSLEGKFSIEHCLSVLLLDGEIGLKQFSLERILDPQVQEMRQRVKVYSRSDLLGETEGRESLAALVTLNLKDGKKLSHFYRQSKREMGIPWPWEDLTRKFKQCAGLALHEKEVEKLMTALRHLEELDRADQLMDLVSGAPEKKRA